MPLANSYLVVPPKLSAYGAKVLKSAGPRTAGKHHSLVNHRSRPELTNEATMLMKTRGLKKYLDGAVEPPYPSQILHCARDHGRVQARANPNGVTNEATMFQKTNDFQKCLAIGFWRDLGKRALTPLGGRGRASVEGGGEIEFCTNESSIFNKINKILFLEFPESQHLVESRCVTAETQHVHDTRCLRLGRHAAQPGEHRLSY